jgi:ribosomal protein S18 acetylase RimI-like enzyme
MLHIKPLSAPDTEAICRVYQAAAALDPGFPAITAPDWQRFVSSPLNENGRLFRTARLHGQLVGVASCSLRLLGPTAIKHFRIVVDPPFRRRGVGRALLAELGAIPVEASEVCLQTVVDGRWDAARAFVEFFGFQILESEVEMHCPPMTNSKLTLSPNITQIEITPAQAGELARLHNEAYRDTASFVPMTPDSFRKSVAEDDRFFVLRIDKRTVGYAHIVPGAKALWLESLVVSETHRGQGLGSELLCHVLGTAAVESAIVRLQVTDANHPALGLYRKAGFLTDSISHRYRILEQVLRRV